MKDVSRINRGKLKSFPWSNLTFIAESKLTVHIREAPKVNLKDFFKKITPKARYTSLILRASTKVLVLNFRLYFAQTY